MATAKVVKSSGRGSKPGERRGGRRAGTPNKTTTAAKEAIALAFEQMGGTDGLVLWASESEANKRAFYTQVWPKIVPLQVNGAGEDGEHLHNLTVKFVRPAG